MQISTRFTEYGLTGALFWLSQAALLSIYAGEPVTALLDGPEWQALLAQVRDLPEAMQGSVAALLGVIGIIAIFVAGVILELLPSVFTFPQMVAFRNTAQQHEAWLRPWTEACGEPARSDYRRLLDEIPARYVSLQWQAIKGLGHYGRWQRFQALLFARVDVDGQEDGDLGDQLHLWRTSRVIGNIMLLMALEVLFVYQPTGWQYYFLVHIALYLGAWTLTLLSYHRLCFALFGRVCVLHRQSGDCT